MGKKHGQKRQWRKIDTQQLEDDLERVTREERQGLTFERVPDADLFFVDKGGDEDTAAAVAEGQLPQGTVVSKKLRARQKVLRSEAILQALGNAKPPSKVVPRKPKGPAAGHKQQQQQQQQQLAAAAGQLAAPRRSKRGGAVAEAGAFDLWAADAAALPPVTAAPGEVEAAVISAKRRRTGSKPGAAAPHIRAVEIDAPGCSFNPDRELHQDAVAEAVAGEMQKMINKELAPVAPPRTVDYDVEQDELLMLQTLEQPEEEHEAAAAAQQSGEEEQEEEGGAATAAARRQLAKKTQKDRNREKRRRAAEEAAEAAAKLKKQRRELDALKQLQAEVEAAAAEEEARRARLAADRAERAAQQPPKLGKLAFEPMPMQVLTSTEVSGSLRRLKPTAMLAKDRFKSLQKRGAIEPRKRITQAKAGKKIEYLRGERADRAAERQAEIEELRQQKRKAAKTAKQQR